MRKFLTTFSQVFLRFFVDRLFFNDFCRSDFFPEFFINSSKEGSGVDWVAEVAARRRWCMR